MKSVSRAKPLDPKRSSNFEHTLYEVDFDSNGHQSCKPKSSCFKRETVEILEIFQCCMWSYYSYFCFHVKSNKSPNTQKSKVILSRFRSPWRSRPIIHTDHRSQPLIQLYGRSENIVWPKGGLGKLSSKQMLLACKWLLFTLTVIRKMREGPVSGILLE